jgi:hypothetical protein
MAALYGVGNGVIFVEVFAIRLIFEQNPPPA